MSLSKDQVLPRLIEIIEPFNKKGIDVSASTSFANDLELDSLTVMDLVAEIEDEYDILLPVNLLPDLETVGDVAGAVADIKNKQ